MNPSERTRITKGIAGKPKPLMVSESGDHVIEVGDQASVAIENAEMYQQGRPRSPFLANMGHELRTPLNAIIGFSELLLDDSANVSPEEQREFLGDILRNGRHLLRLIDAILDLSKVQAGQMELRPEECLPTSTPSAP